MQIFIIFSYIYIYINNTKYNIYIYIYIYIIILNRAGPAQTTGPGSAPKLVGRIRPKMYWADLSPKKTLLGQTRPRRQGLVRPKPLSRAQPKIVGRFRPKLGWADLGPKKKKTFSSGPDPAQKTGLGQDPPGPSRNGAGGIIFPPPLHAERYSFCMRGRKKK